MNDNDNISRIYSSRQYCQYTDEVTDEALNRIFAPKGWICPKCGRVYSPSTSECFYCNNQNAQSGVSTNLDMYVSSRK